MPLAGHVARPGLVDRPVLAVEVDAFAAAILAAPVAVIVEGAHAEAPESGPAEEADRERVAADEVERSIPERPVGGEMRDRPPRMADRAPFPVLGVAVAPDPGVVEQARGLRVLGLVEVAAQE